MCYQNKVDDHAPECREVYVEFSVRRHVADQQDGHDDHGVDRHDDHPVRNFVRNYAGRHSVVVKRLDWVDRHFDRFRNKLLRGRERRGPETNTVKLILP